MVRAKKYVVKSLFKGKPKREDYEIVEYELPPLKDGEILIKAEWISVDPYLRAFNARETAPFDQYGFQVGVVQESKSPDYPVGTRVSSHQGWCTYSIVNTAPTNVYGPRLYKLPDLKGLSPSLGIGAVGMPGVTAYYGFHEVCKSKPGDTVVVTGAAGAVGSIVGQLAKIKGCRVIGFTGSDEKVAWLKELGFDHAFNYKKVDIRKSLKEAAPNGIDCYFDNVGGEVSSIIISLINHHGKIAVCGSISAYNDDPENMPKATIVQPYCVFKELTIEGFEVWRWLGRWHEAFEVLIDLIKSGKLKPRETIVEGFDKIFDTFAGMMVGDTIGKAVIKV